MSPTANTRVRRVPALILALVMTLVGAPMAAASQPTGSVTPAYENPDISACLQYRLDLDTIVFRKEADGKTFIMTCRTVRHIDSGGTGHPIPIDESGEFYLCVEYTIMYGISGPAPLPNSFQRVWHWVLEEGSSKAYINDTPDSSGRYHINTVFTMASASNDWVKCTHARP